MIINLQIVALSHWAPHYEFYLLPDPSAFPHWCLFSHPLSLSLFIHRLSLLVAYMIWACHASKVEQNTNSCSSASTCMIILRCSFSFFSLCLFIKDKYKKILLWCTSFPCRHFTKSVSVSKENNNNNNNLKFQLSSFKMLPLIRYL